MRKSLTLSALLVFLASAAELAAQDAAKAEIVTRSKNATALVEAKRGMGSAFCIHDSGLFVTNEHVVHGVTDVRLVLHPSLMNEEIVTAKVIRTDEDMDLALLKVSELAEFTPLPLGSVDGLAELAEVMAVGFPFGKNLAQKKGEYPAVSVNAGKISSLRMKDGELHRIQMDAVVNPGNSGGPLLDSRGKVIGVVVSGVRGASVNFAVPVSHLLRFASTPDVEVVLPEVKYEDRFKPIKFQAKTTAPFPAVEPYQVELILAPPQGPSRSFKMTLEKGTYRAEAAPLALDQNPRTLNVTISYPNGTLQGPIKDQTIKLDAQEVKLSDIKTLRFAPQPTAELFSQKRIKGIMTGFDELALTLGTDTLKLQPSKALMLTFAPPVRDTSVQCTVVVRRRLDELIRVRDSLSFQGAPKEPVKPLLDVTHDPKAMDGFWVLEHAESDGKSKYPIKQEEAIYIEARKLQWVSKAGKVLANAPEAEILVDTSKNPMNLEIIVQIGGKRTWLAIYKLEGERLIIATNCDEDRRPTEFSTRGPGGAAFVRTYKRSSD